MASRFGLLSMSSWVLGGMERPCTWRPWASAIASHNRSRGSWELSFTNSTTSEWFCNSSSPTGAMNLSKYTSFLAAILFSFQFVAGPSPQVCPAAVQP